MAKLGLQINGLAWESAGAFEEGTWVELSALPGGATLALELDSVVLEPFMRPGDPAWRWRWQAPHGAGEFALVLRAYWPAGRREELRASLEVVPRKLDQERYALLLEDLQHLGRALVFALSGGRLGGTPASDPAPPGPAEELHGLFGADLLRLEAAVGRLARRPPERRRAASTLVEPGRLRDFSALGRVRPATLADASPPSCTADPQFVPTEAGLLSQADQAGDQGGSAEHALALGVQPPASEAWGGASGGEPAPGVQPPASEAWGGAAEHEPAALAAQLGALSEPGFTASYASYEARLLRRLLVVLGRRLTRLEGQIGRQPGLSVQVAQARRRIETMQAQPFLAGVAPLEAYRGPTQRLRRDADYRVVYAFWRRLRMRPLLGWDAATLSLPVAALPQLYERWCAARVAQALLTLPGWAVATQALLSEADGDWLLGLPVDGPLVTLVHPDGTQLGLRYQPRYVPAGAPLRSLDRHTRVPDLALELTRPGAGLWLVVLDAKYRLDAAGGVPEEALADAYSYLGAIGRPDGSRANLGVALLYPGTGAALSYASGVAALPLLPGAGMGALEAWLAERLAALDAGFT
jgi:hypothetical protein